MDFVEFLTALLAVLGNLLQQWPALVIAVVFIPALRNLAEYVAGKLGIPFNSNNVLFGLNLLAFAGYTVARIAGVDLSGIDPVLISVATIINVLLGLLGGVVSKVVNRTVWQKVPVKALSG